MICLDFSLSIFGSERGLIILRLHYCYFINLENLSFVPRIYIITTQSERKNKEIKKNKKQKK